MEITFDLLVVVEDILRKGGASDEHIKKQLSEVKAKFSG